MSTSLALRAHAQISGHPDISGVIPNLPSSTTSQSTIATGVTNHLAPTSISSPSTGRATASLPPTSTSLRSESHMTAHILPIIITAPVVFSITLLGLIAIWYFRRGKGSRAVLPPNTEVHGPVTQANAMNRLSRRIEPFHIFRNEPRSELLSMKMISRSGRLQFKRGHQVGDLFRVTPSGDDRLLSTVELVEDNQVSREENIDQPQVPQGDSEALLPTGPAQALAEQLEALRERLQIMEDNMTHLDLGLGHNVPPPQYTPPLQTHHNL